MFSLIVILVLVLLFLFQFSGAGLLMEHVSYFQGDCELSNCIDCDGGGVGGQFLLQLCLQAQGGMSQRFWIS